MFAEVRAARRDLKQRLPLSSLIRLGSLRCRPPRMRSLRLPFRTYTAGRGAYLPHGLIRRRDKEAHPFSSLLSKCVFIRCAGYNVQRDRVGRCLMREAPRFPTRQWLSGPGRKEIARELCHDRRAVGFDRALVDVKPRSDRFVRVTGDD